MKITSPVAIVNEEQARKNIENMATKARESHVRFRPHFKTHQSREVGEWFRDAGVTAITVSSVGMARYFHAAGWHDITVAIPVNLLEIPALNLLAEDCQLGVLVDSTHSAAQLARRIDQDMVVWIEIDTGNPRSGLPTTAPEAIDAIVEIVTRAPHLTLAGFLTHAGHAYQASSMEAIRDVAHESTRQLEALRDRIQVPEGTSLEISVGDTPTCRAVEYFPSTVDEIRPGNFVFFDLMMVQLGVCEPDEVAFHVHCPIISRSKARSEVIVYGGAVHLSMAHIPTAEGEPCYGLVGHEHLESGRVGLIEGARVVGLSQEHGRVCLPREYFDQLQIGDKLVILPVHACLTANLFPEYWTTNGRVVPTYRYSSEYPC